MTLAALDPIPRHMSLAPRGLGPTPDTLAFLDRMTKSIAEALGLPTLEAVTAEYLGDVSTPLSRHMLAEKARHARDRHAVRLAISRAVNAKVRGKFSGPLHGPPERNRP